MSPISNWPHIRASWALRRTIPAKWREILTRSRGLLDYSNGITHRKHYVNIHRHCNLGNKPTLELYLIGLIYLMGISHIARRDMAPLFDLLRGHSYIVLKQVNQIYPSNG